MENFRFFMKQAATIVACFAVCFTWMGCPVEPEPLKNDKAVFENFTFAGIVGTATINESASTITAKATATTDLTKIAPVFSVSQGATVTVNGTPQVSGSTQNNFTNSVIYVVISEDAKTNKPWTVSITKEGSDPGELNDLANFETFTFTGIDGTATIKVTDATITAKALATADLTTIKAKFTVSKGATVKVGTTAQVSEQTVNNFTTPVTYNLVSEDGKTTRNWVVTITKEGIVPGEVIELTNAMINASANVTLPVAIYQVKSNLTLQGGNTLTIQPGTEIRFDKDRSLTANANSKIIAKGTGSTASQKITFTSSMQNPAAGDWHGLWLYGTNNEFAWCVFEYGSGYQTAIEGGFLLLYDTGTASVLNCTFRNSKYSGVALRGTGSRFTAFDYNTITNCGESPTEADSYPIYSNSGLMNLVGMGANNTIITEKGIGINGGTVNANLTLRKHTYIIAYNSPTFNNSAVVTIDAGATLKFNTNRSIEVKAGARIIADGTAEPITFTSNRENRQAGDWYGIHIIGSNGSEFKNCIFEYGSGYQTAIEGGLLYLEDSKASVLNCIFRYGKYSGVALRGTSSGFTAFDNNTIIDCGENEVGSYPIYSNSGFMNLAGMGSNNTLTSTNGKGIGINGGTVNASMTLRKHKYHLVYNSPTINAAAIFTIEPGTIVKLGSNRSINVSGGAKIIAKGTEQDKITFTSNLGNPDLGDWYGINITSSNGSEFEHCIFEYGSGSQTAIEGGMLYLDDSKASVMNCTFRNSQYSGVSLRGGSSGFITFDRNIFTNCGEADVEIYSFPLYAGGGGAGIMNLSALGANNTFNSTKGIGINGGTVNANMTLTKYEYTITGNITISNSASNATLTIEPGTKLKFGQNLSVNIGAGGRLYAQGTSTNRIVFTATSPEKGWWYGIHFTNSNASTVSGGSLLEYCDISYGGAGTNNLSSNGNITCIGIGAGVLTVKNSAITNSRSWGILVRTSSPSIGSSPTTETVNFTNDSNNTFSNNGQFGYSHIGSAEIGAW